MHPEENQPAEHFRESDLIRQRRENFEDLMGKAAIASLPKAA